MVKNTMKGKRAACEFLERSKWATTIPEESYSVSPSLFNVHKTRFVVKGDGLEAILSATEKPQNNSDSDYISYIFYLEGDRIKIAGLTRCYCVERELPNGFGLITHWKGGNLRHDLYIIWDMSQNIPSMFTRGVGAPENLPQYRVKSTIFQKTVSLDRHDNPTYVLKTPDEKIGLTFGWPDDETNPYRPDFLNSFINNGKDRIILAMVKAANRDHNSHPGMSYLFFHRNMGDDTGFLFRFVPIGLSFGSDFSRFYIVSYDFTPKEMYTYIRERKTKFSYHNVPVCFPQAHSSGESGRTSFYNCQVFIEGKIQNQDEKIRLPTKEKMIVTDKGSAIFRLDSTRFKEGGIDVDIEHVKTLMSYEDGVPAAPRAIINTDGKLLSIVRKNYEYVWNWPGGKDTVVPFSLVKNLEDSIFKKWVSDRGFGDLIKDKFCSDGTARDNAVALINVGRGLVFAYPRVQLKDDGLFIPFSGANVVALSKDAERYREEIEYRIIEKETRIKEALGIEKIATSIKRSFNAAKEASAHEALREIKEALEIGSSDRIEDLFDFQNRDTRGFAGPMFIVDLMKELGPIGWGFTISKGELMWFRDTLRYEIRSAGGGFETIQEQEKVFLKWQTDFHSSIVIRRGQTGYEVETKFFGVGWHPNVSSDGSLCHGGTGSSIFIEKDGKNMVQYYNQKNGRLTFKEAIKAVRFFANLLEMSVKCGDAWSGHSRPVYDAVGLKHDLMMRDGVMVPDRTRTVDPFRLIPRHRFSIFDWDSIPEYRRDEIKKVYRHFKAGDPIIATHPKIAERIFSGLKMVMKVPTNEDYKTHFPVFGPEVPEDFQPSREEEVFEVPTLEITEDDYDDDLDEEPYGLGALFG